jgi:sulfur carrier protein
MKVEVELVGETTRTVRVSDGATYADLLGPFEVTRHEVSVVVDGRPVPTDRQVDDDLEAVRIVRLVKGG